MRLLLLLASFLTLSTAALAADSLDRRPNVILFLVDDMGWRDCGAYGSQYYETPNIDRFAKQSMRFTDAYSCPLCSPTRASLMTGQYSSRHGITSATGHLIPQAPGASLLPTTAPSNQPLLMPKSRNYLEPSQYTLAEALRDAGYRTGHFGKWHLGLTKPHWPEAQGFDFAFHYHPDPGPPGQYFSPYGVVAEGDPSKRKVGTITDGPPGEYIVDRLTDEAIGFIEQKSDKPFFVNFWQYGVHGPWGHKEAYTDEFAKKKDPTGKQANPIMGSMLRSIDESVGKLLAKLDELKLTDNTIVIFMSDNGGNTHSNTPTDRKFADIVKNNGPKYADWRKWAGELPPTNNDPLRDGKGRVYEGGIRVPLMVRWPQEIPAGSVDQSVVGCVDIYPTVLDLVGVKTSPSQKIDGISLAPLLKRTGTLDRSAYFTWFPDTHPGVVVRQGPWKLIRRLVERPSEYEGLHELFNLESDLSETTNLASKHPEKVAELNILIDQFLRDTNALTPKPNPNFKPTTIEATPPADRASGLVPKGCKIEIVSGSLRVFSENAEPFLGTVQVKHAGPLMLKLRMRSTGGGTGKIHWKHVDQKDFPAGEQLVEFTCLAGSNWQDILVQIPVTSKLGIVRLYMPQGSTTTEFESIEFTDTVSGKPVHAWSFK